MKRDFEGKNENKAGGKGKHFLFSTEVILSGDFTFCVENTNFFIHTRTTSVTYAPLLCLFLFIITLQSELL